MTTNNKRARVLSASAGSGKTFRLAYKFVLDTIKHYDDKPYLYRATLAVTFTNKATEEMKNRILEKLGDIVKRPAESDYMPKLREDLNLPDEEIMHRANLVMLHILHDYSHFNIMTIDKFFLYILRSFLKELSLDLNPNIEIKISSLIDRSIDALIEDIRSDEKLKEWITKFSFDTMMESGKWDIHKELKKFSKKAFDSSDSIVFENNNLKELLPGIIKQYKQKLLNIESEMQQIGQRARELMDKQNVAIKDFQQASKSAAQYLINAADKKWRKDAATETIENQLFNNAQFAKTSAAQEIEAELVGLGQELYNKYLEFFPVKNTHKLIKTYYHSFALTHDLYVRLQQCQKEDRSIALIETKRIISQLISANNDAGCDVAPFIYEKVGNRFERFMIDEFQDTSYKEWNNFVPLLSNAMSQDDDESVFIVGDVKQSIYRFRGSDWRILAQDVQRQLGKDDVKFEPLEDNWRSAPNIVEFNNSFIKSIVDSHNTQLNETLDTARDEPRTISDEQHASLYDTLKNAYANLHQTPKKTKGPKGYIHIENYEGVSPFTNCIDDVIKRGYKYSDITIMYRSSKSAPDIIKQLLEYKQNNNLDFNIRTQQSLIIGNASICQFLAAVLRLSQDRNDVICRALINQHQHSESTPRAYDDKLTDEEVRLLNRICQMPPNEAFEHIVDFFKLNEQEDNIAYLQAMQEQILEFCKNNIFDIQLYLKYWDEEGCKESISVSKSENSIEILTIHKAKGLENKIIIIPYCSWDLSGENNKVIWADTSNIEGMEDIRRYPIGCSKELVNSAFAFDYYNEKIYSHTDGVNMLYVATTRAVDELYIYVPKARDNNISSLVTSAINSLSADKKCPLKISQENLFEWGEKAEREQEKDEDRNNEKTIMLKEYQTNLSQSNLRLSTQRYYQDKATDMATQREVGIMMHSILCEATDRHDIETRIKEACTDGRLTAEQAEELHQVIKREFSRREVQEWFSDQWDMVRNEQDIIVGGKTIGTRRPDRVMIKGRRAVVVDYKFGNETNKEYDKKMLLYIDLLKQMGYEEVEGYLWYLTIGEIKQVK